MLAPALGRNVGDRSFQHLEQRLLHAFATDVTSNADVVAGFADLVDLVDIQDAALSRFEVEVGRMQQLQQQVLDVFADIARFGQRGRIADGERHVEDACERASEQGFAAACRPDEHDVGLLDLDIRAFEASRQTLIVIMHRHREDLFALVLPDHVLIEMRDDLARRGDLVK